MFRFASYTIYYRGYCKEETEERDADNQGTSVSRGIGLAATVVAEKSCGFRHHDESRTGGNSDKTEFSDSLAAKPDIKGSMTFDTS